MIFSYRPCVLDSFSQKHIEENSYNSMLTKTADWRDQMRGGHHRRLSAVDHRPFGKSVRWASKTVDSWSCARQASIRPSATDRRSVWKSAGLAFKTVDCWPAWKVLRWASKTVDRRLPRSCPKTCVIGIVDCHRQEKVRADHLRLSTEDQDVCSRLPIGRKKFALDPNHRPQH